MGKIYMRAGISPVDNFDPAHVLLKNSIGSNVGNLIYAYGMFRILTTPENTVVPNYYRIEPDNADQINEMYDCFVIPLADAFRANFMPELRKMTKLIKRLKIPCIVTGVGLRAPFEHETMLSFSFDGDVKRFIKAVLEKSSIVGVRGKITAAYLSRLGFKEGTHHVAIGCPSMYTFGRNLTIRQPVLTENARIAINASVLAPNTVQYFLYRTMQAIPDHYFLPQRLQELRLLYTGQPYVIPAACESYPCKITDAVYMQDRVRFFLQAVEWIDFLKTMDLSVGSRLHGNIAATLAGTPSILIPHDARMRELTEFHSLPHVWAKDVSEKTNVFDLVAQLDFQKVSREHGRNFDRFVSFLNTNGLSHIYQGNDANEKAPLDLQTNRLLGKSVVSSIRNCTLEEMAERWQSYCSEMDRRYEKLKVQCGKGNKGHVVKKFDFFGRKYEIRRMN